MVNSLSGNVARFGMELTLEVRPNSLLVIAIDARVIFGWRKPDQLWVGRRELKPDIVPNQFDGTLLGAGDTKMIDRGTNIREDHFGGFPTGIGCGDAIGERRGVCFW
jgi:hypothetical protein